MICPCLFTNRVREDFLSGVRSGVNGTPTFYIDNIRYNGSWDLETLLETLRSAIKKARRINRRLKSSVFHWSLGNVILFSSCSWSRRVGL